LHSWFCAARNFRSEKQLKISRIFEHENLAFLQPEVLVERLMAEIDRIPNTRVLCPSPSERIAELEQKIDRLQRTEEAIAVATGALRERRCPAWIVLGVKAVEARGVRAA
jgi:hypothetical protein